jgi:hypothetical protein
MATKEEMDAFHADQRHVEFESFADAAICALKRYELDECEKQRLAIVADGSAGMLGMNWMIRDMRDRLLWIHGSADVEPVAIRLTYLASEWGPDHPANDAVSNTIDVGAEPLRRAVTPDCEESPSP